MPEDDGWQVYRRGPTGCFTSSRLPPTCWTGSTQKWCWLVLTIWMLGGVVILNNLDEKTGWSVKCWLFTSWCQPTKTIRFYLIHGQSPRWWSQGLNAGHLRSALFVWPSTQVEGCVRTIDFFVFLFRKAMGILLEDIWCPCVLVQLWWPCVSVSAVPNSTGRLFLCGGQNRRLYTPRSKISYIFCSAPYS